MKCPKCGGNTKIKESRQREHYYFRRHECLKCHARFSTHEVYEEDYAKIKAVKRIERMLWRNDGK